MNMRKNRTVKLIFNGALLAVMAILGVTAYQVSSRKEQIQEVLPLESVNKENSADEGGNAAGNGTVDMQTAQNNLSSAETGTSLVEADLEDLTGTGTDNSFAGEIAGMDEISGTRAAGTDNITEMDNASNIGESTSVNAQVAVNNAPEINFSEDTLMEWPVSGQILIDYSMDQSVYFPTLDQYKLSPAIAVQAVEGAPVMSAVNGKVYAIENDAQTGTTVTMELGNGYQAIYGQLKDLSVAEGDTVKKGDIIGYVAAPTKYYSEEGSNLYFAMKQNGEPIDPITYLP